VGEFEDTQEINDLVIRMDANGRAIRIQDVATVNDTLEERAIISKLDGNPSVTLFVYKKADGNIIKVMEDIRKYMENFKNDIPGLEATVRNDGSIDVKTVLILSEPVPFLELSWSSFPCLYFWDGEMLFSLLLVFRSVFCLLSY